MSSETCPATPSAMLISIAYLTSVASAATMRCYVKTSDGKRPKPIIAVDNVCAWPNLTLLRDRTIIATIFSKPSHGQMEGDVVCYASRDGGKTWRLRGIAAPHEPRTNRMNVAAGLARNGDLLVLASGWSDIARPGQKPLGQGPFRVEILAPWICRSADGGKTWSVNKRSFPTHIPGGYKCVPFGDIIAGHDGKLRVAVYSGTKAGDRVYVYRSADDGKTWVDPVPLDPSRPKRNRPAPPRRGQMAGRRANRRSASVRLNR